MPAQTGKEGAEAAGSGEGEGGAQKPRVQGYTGGTPSKAGRRLTVHWTDAEPDRPLAEVRHYAVVAPIPPRW